MLLLDKDSLYRMRLEYQEVYEQMFAESFSILPKVLSIMLLASEKC